MAAKFVLLFIFCVVNGVSMGEASHKVPASSLSPWYCQRLVPAFITAAVTPCTYPCLFLSPHGHPRIVVHPERDGTPCRIATGVGHHYEVGKCGGSVCRQPLPHITLKRKKRFICLYAFVKWIKAKRRLAELKAMIEKLEKEVAAAGARGVPAAGSEGIRPAGFGRGAAENIGSGGTYLGGTENSAGIGAVGNSRSPGGNHATLNLGDVGNNVSPGLTDGLGLRLFGNTGTGSGNPESAFALPGEDGRLMGPPISAPTLSNIGGMGAGVSGLGENGIGRTSNARISGNTLGVIGISSSGHTAGRPDVVGGGNSAALRSSTHSTSSGGVLALNSGGGGSVTAIGTATSGSTVTGPTPPGRNNVESRTTIGTTASSTLLPAVRS